MSKSTVLEALAKFTRASVADDVARAEKERKEILTRFPLESWPTLPLERYALGQGVKEDTYCWWLEFGSKHIGSMSGGSSAKHIVYKRKNKPGWFFPSEFKTVEEAWEAVRAGFVAIFELARQNRWDEIHEGPAGGWGPGLTVKSLHVYFPDQILPIMSRVHLQHFLRLMEMPEGDQSGYDVVQYNRTLLTALRALPGLHDWPTYELARLLYTAAHPRETKRVVKIAPGDDAKYWGECRAGGYVCVGWDEVGPLTDFESKDDFREAFIEKFGGLYKDHKPTLTRKANELWTLAELEPGDLIVANKGTSRILAVGEVTDPPYEYRTDRAQYRHCVRVKWDESYARDIEPQKRWGLVTVADVPASIYERLLVGRRAVPVDPILPRMAEALESKGQLVLYGPPGTGKTYQARRFAVWWLARQAGNTEAAEILAVPDAFERAEAALAGQAASRRTWWIVANPSEWKWDELFEEGRTTYRFGRLQRNYSKVQPGDRVLGYQSTPDRQVVAIAQVSRGVHLDANGKKQIEITPVAKVRVPLEYEDLRQQPILEQCEPFRFNNQGTLFALTETESETLFDLLSEKNPDLRDQLELAATVGQLTRVTFHASYSYEDFVEGFRPMESAVGGLSLRLEDGIFKRICRTAQANPDKKYLLLIDELNRANVAKVLGELLTLLELDKRNLTVTLPQSKESFSIPKNVFLLATMNTADRSIKLLDAALRRRFAFMELMPDATLLQGARVKNLRLDDFLTELNRRIVQREGREKQVGHSYLLANGAPLSETDEFARRFRQEILPLLQEYCYDDYGVLAKYIGEKLVDRESHTLRDEVVSDPDVLVDTLAAEFGATEQEE